MVKLSDNEVVKMQIKRIEKEIRDTPHHKGTDHHIGRLRAKISKLKEKELEVSSKKGGGGGYQVKKQGDATVVLVGPPSAGKSTLLNKLTNAKSKVAPYAFTTVTVVPGMMNYQDARIQILDVPGLIEGAEEGKGRGREVLSVARAADLLILMSDTKRSHVIDNIKEALYRNGIRLNTVPPNVVVEKKLRGGIVIYSNIKQSLSKQTIAEVAKEYRYTNAEITIREKLTIDRLIDSFSKNRVYVHSLIVINKVDSDEVRYRELASKDKSILGISAEKNINIKKLRSTIWKTLGFTRLYLVKQNEKPHKNSPLVVKGNISLQEVLIKIGDEFAESKKNATIWGTGAKFPGQSVSLKTKVEDKMIIRFE